MDTLWLFFTAHIYIASRLEQQPQDLYFRIFFSEDDRWIPPFFFFPYSCLVSILRFLISTLLFLNCNLQIIMDHRQIGRPVHKIELTIRESRLDFDMTFVHSNETVDVTAVDSFMGYFAMLSL